MTPSISNDLSNALSFIVDVFYFLWQRLFYYFLSISQNVTVFLNHVVSSVVQTALVSLRQMVPSQSPSRDP